MCEKECYDGGLVGDMWWGGKEERLVDGHLKSLKAEGLLVPYSSHFTTRTSACKQILIFIPYHSRGGLRRKTCQMEDARAMA